MKITWTKTEYYEWTGISEDQEYVIRVMKLTDNSDWEWTIFGGSGEYSMFHSFEDEVECEDYFPDAETAKAAAEKALINYLKEKTTA